MKKTILVFASLILALLVLFQLSSYSIISGDMTTEWAVAIIAIVFFVIGIYINKRSLAKKTKPLGEIDHQKIKQLEITSREYEVLTAIASGLSNKEIAAKLFLSESTIKTHVSSLLLKLDAKRRTQAVQKAKELYIL
ncbi:response regulator transcription factor [Flavobacteriaceae bacterium S356]|uniref:Response regulator transcription factor n=1 Tax=Asprobacillus argus TaxID=3076534 RepID=A0ABU3LCI7_9FLAO|nr:response regulator transcription factor [Flavobacteriaceae bacterium S356]